MKVFFRYIVYIIVIICIVVELVTGSISKNVMTLFYIHAKDSEVEVPDTDIITHNIPKEYLKLLKLKEGCCNDSTENKLFLSSTIESEFRNPISIFIYDKKYYVQVYKMSKSYCSSITNEIKENFTEAKKPYHASYILIDGGPTVYEYKSSKPLEPKMILLRLDGENNHIILKNDSMVYYSSMFRGFSIQYSQTGFDDIYGETREGLFSVKYQPLEMIFLKRENNLYLFTMSIYKKGIKYSPGTLYNIIEGK